MTFDNLSVLERQSVQELPDAKKGDTAGFFWVGEPRSPLLYDWGTRQRERQLRQYWRNPYNWMGQGAISGLIKKVKSAHWTIKGKRRVDYFQEVFRQANFGRGWGHFISQVLLDYSRQDAGGFIEIIAPGNPMRPPTGAVTGIAYLDAMQCYPTGDPEFPVIYFDRKGGKHLMHRTRVYQLVDLPDGDERNPGYGYSALTRAITIVVQQIYMNHYIETSLDDKPPPGVAVLKGITQQQRDAAMTAYRAEQNTDASPEWGRILWFYSLDPSQQIEVVLQAFAQAPDKFSYKEYTELHTNAWALALNTDVQEIWQLTAGNIGSAGQSEVLHAKSQGKAFGDILTTVERVLNDILPESNEFQFKRRDPLEEGERATAAQSWAGFNTSVAGTLSVEEQRQLLANTVEEYRDVVTDPDGTIRVLSDADPEAATEDEVTAADDTPSTAGTQADPQVADSEKAIGDTRAEFIALFKDLVNAVQSGDMNRRRAGVVMRGQLSRLGRKAYADGLEEGGIDELSEDDQARLLVWVAEQSRFVTQFLDNLAANGLTHAQVNQHAEMWAGKSLEEAHRLGQLAANANGLYVWSLGLADHCPSCLKMAGQVHRLGTYVRKGIVPKSPKLNCTFGCKCKLIKTAGKASGRWL